MKTLHQAASALAKARAAQTQATLDAAAAAIAAAADGRTEVDIAQALGVNRLTVRKWLGKDDR